MHRHIPGARNNIIYTYINLYSLCSGKVFRIRGRIRFEESGQVLLQGSTVGRLNAVIHLVWPRRTQIILRHPYRDDDFWYEAISTFHVELLLLLLYVPLMLTYFAYISFSDGVCRNRKFDKLTRSDFQLRMQAELKAAKERVRSRKRGPCTKPSSSSQEPRMPRSFWSEQQQEEETDDLWSYVFTWQ